MITRRESSLPRRAVLSIAPSAVTLALVGCGPAPSTLSGRWAGALVAPADGRYSIVLELREHESAVTGTLEVGGTDPAPIADGRRRGDSVFFSPTDQFAMPARGRLEVDSLRLVFGDGPAAPTAAVGRAPLTPAQAAAARRPPPEPLWSGAAPGAKAGTPADRPTITPYLPPAAKRSGSAVVVFPGGGYVALAVGAEGHDAARWLNSLGVAAFVVRYRLGPAYRHPAMLTDAQRAIRTVRARAKEWGVDPERVGVIGFSAGGHLASTVATHFDGGDRGASDPIETVSSRPDLLMLIYPVVSMDSAITHYGSRTALLGEEPDSELVRLLSNESQVTRETPPTFLVHAATDGIAPVENSLRLFEALRRVGVPVELHVYERGPHGRGLARSVPLMSSWPALAEAWLRFHGWLGEGPTRESP